MFNVVQSALRKKKKDEKSEKDKAEIRLQGAAHKNEAAPTHGDMPPHEELKKSFEELLVCTSFFDFGKLLHKPSPKFEFDTLS